MSELKKMQQTKAVQEGLEKGKAEPATRNMFREEQQMMKSARTEVIMASALFGLS